ncbi:hypothetical protein BS47DRAFT_1395074 [Hydnum rufescens UP504]|uniref:FAD/NAD(P)-binding domain-containing protein n=1 Tax=Hydnum rufescens UP504 TaxID=1448309 RepID=A0A9P6ASW0_9AGAM|nr:hypothetical protein BS47DRAFT_1395074 [Hydnum rufescens UP504]
MRLQSLPTIFGLGVVEVIADQLQTPLAFASSGPYTEFPSIRRVAVIGAGPSGLQSAVTLLEHGFEVRLFERRPKPGGNWFYSALTPLPAAFPSPELEASCRDRPIEFAAYTPDIPDVVPKIHIYEDGEDGISNEWRLREHWNPSPVWNDLHTNSAPVFTSLPDVKYPPDTEWVLSHRDVLRHVRQFASYKGLNSNDEEDRPIEFAAYTPDIPDVVPKIHIYEDGEDGISNEWRLREHWSPSPVWNDVHTNTAPIFTSLPDVKYSPDTPGDIGMGPQSSDVLRHVRQFASYKGLHSNDEESANATSYSTRVERLRKSPDGKTWRLHLRKLEQLQYSNGRLRAEWWTEDFDAVVVSAARFDAPHIPSIEGLAAWARAFPRQIYHSFQYREPEALRGKIARAVAPYVKALSISLRKTHPSPAKRRTIHRLPANITRIPEIRAFSKLKADAVDRGLPSASLTLFSGSVIGGFDEIIFATGYLRSHPFLVDFHNSSIIGRDEPEVKVAPIITDGTHLRSLHWTGHYINDPTLAVSNDRPWTLGRYQSLGFAKTWSGKARLPNQEQMWAEYPGGRNIVSIHPFGSLLEQAENRLWVAWLNNASLEFGGRLVSPWPIELRTPSRRPPTYTNLLFTTLAWEAGYTTSRNFTEYENTPRDQWKTETIAGITPADEAARDCDWGCEEDW